MLLTTFVFLFAYISPLQKIANDSRLVERLGNFTATFLTRNTLAARYYCPGNQTSGANIITVKEGASRFEVLKHINPRSEMTHLDIINSFSGVFDDATLNSLHRHPDVTVIGEDCFMQAAAVTTQQNSPWGLARLSSNTRIPTTASQSIHRTFTYDHSGGYCADIYIIDSGVRTTHLAFGGRVHNAGAFGNHGIYQNGADDTGHGTQVAGVAASSTYGVAKSATVWSIKVVGATGPVTVQQTITNTIQGLQWAVTHHLSRGRPGVVNMSLVSAAGNAQIDQAVNSAIQQGLTVVAAAGNAGEEVTPYHGASPARVPGVITVGAVDIHDHRHHQSNYGSAVDIFAPGVDVMTTTIGWDTATTTSSGTSIAAPHVAGLVAYLMCLPPYHHYTPAQIKAKVIRHSLKGVLGNIPAGTPNRLAHLPLHH